MSIGWPIIDRMDGILKFSIAIPTNCVIIQPLDKRKEPIMENVLVSKEALQTVLDYLAESESISFEEYQFEHGTGEGHIMDLVDQLQAAVNSQA